MSNWKQYYVYGEYEELLAWLVKTWPCTDDSDKPYTVPHNVAFRGNYLLPQRKTGTVVDEFGQEHDVYEPIKGRRASDTVYSLIKPEHAFRRVRNG